MATYFIDPATGNDAADGLSEANAIKNYSKSNFLSGLSAGDTVKQKKNTTYTGGITIAVSGTAASKITFTHYGSGDKPKINANGATNGGIYASGKTDIVIDGLEIYNATVSGSAATNFLNCERISVKNSYLHDSDTGVKFDNNSANAQYDIEVLDNLITNTQQSGVGIVSGTSSGGRIVNITVNGNTTRFTSLGGSHPRGGIFITSRAVSWDETKSPVNIEVVDNNISWSADYGILCTGCSGGIINHNEVSHVGYLGLYDTHGIAVHGGKGVSVCFNKVHDNGILEGGSNGSGVGIYLDQFANTSQGFGLKAIGNEVWNLSRTGANTAVYRSAGIVLFRQNNAEVYGNYVHHCLNGILAYGTDSGGQTEYCRIENNTVSDIDEFAIVVAHKSDNIIVQNNLVTDAWVAYQEESGASAVTNTTRQYNCAYNSSNIAWAAGTESAPTAGSAGTGDIETDPGVNKIFIGTTSPCYETGVYSSKARDINNRKLKNPPDMGAFQYFIPRTAS